MLNRPHVIAASVVVLLVLIALNLPNQTAAQVKLAFSSLFLPLFGVAGSAQSLAEKAGNTVVPRRVLLSQLEQLRAENQQLRFQAVQTQEALRENNRLRQALAFPKNPAWKLKPARVVGRDPSNWWRTLQISVGSRDGVQADLPVLSADGLVGRISSVSLSHSQVILVGDPNCRVSALIQETRENGIIGLSASGALDPMLVDMTYLSRNSVLKPGQTVVTSGLGGIFPKGIKIGEIVDSRTVENDLYYEARVKLAANFNLLEEVWVVMP